MKKTWLKAASIFLALVFVTSALAACGGTKTEETKQAGTTPVSGTANTQKSAAPVEIKMPVYDRGVQGEPPVDNNYWTKWMQEKALKDINVKVTYVPIPRNQDVDKFNMLLAANEAPDVIYSYDYPVISSFFSRGAFQEIPKAMLDQYGANLQKFLGADLLKYGVIDGKQYLIPAKRPMLGDVALTIRQDWLDKLGLKAPTNTDELYAVLKAFKEQDPGGVGAENVIPYAISGFGNTSLCVPYYAFIPDNVSEEEFAIYSDLIISPLTWEPEKEALKYLNKLYNEGLISPEFALDKDNKKAEADFSNGKVGMYSTRVLKSPPVFSTLIKNVPAAKVQAVNSLVKPGNQLKGYAYYPFGMLSGINKNSKNPEAVIKYLDWMCKQENLTILQNGFEGKTYTVKDGLPILDGAYTGEERLILGTNKDYVSVVTEQRDTGDMEKNIKMQAVAQAPDEFVDYYIANYKESLKGMTTNNFLFSKPVTSLSKNQQNLKAKFEEAGTRLIMCKPAEFDALYDKYSKEYLASGYQEILDEKKKLYNEMKAAK